MIYAPILSKPIYELDEFVDVASLIQLEQRVALGIAKNKNSISIAFSGPANPALKTWLSEEEYLEVKNSWVNVNHSMPGGLAEQWASLTHDQQLMYTLLTTKSRSLNYALTIRGIAKSSGGNSGRFHLKHLASETEDYQLRKDFEFIFDWLAQQKIFDQIGRVQFFINPEGNSTPIHRDYADRTFKDQYIWIRFNKQKDFFVYDEETKEKFFVNGHVCTFDNHQWHGGEPGEVMGFSLRVDGVFTQLFLEKSGLAKHFN
jgi:hypothetical protein